MVKTGIEKNHFGGVFSLPYIRWRVDKKAYLLIINSKHEFFFPFLSISSHLQQLIDFLNRTKLLYWHLLQDLFPFFVRNNNFSVDVNHHDGIGTLFKQFSHLYDAFSVSVTQDPLVLSSSFKQAKKKAINEPDSYAVEYWGRKIDSSYLKSRRYCIMFPVHNGYRVEQKRWH